MPDIQECKDLVTNLLPKEYPGTDYIILLETTPTKILQNSKIALWAQSTSGEKRVNMRMPSIKRALERLAENGPGDTTEVNGIKFMFTTRKLLQ
jgi:hypothetical protein